MTFAAGRSFFFTVPTHRREPIFASPAAVQRLRTSLRYARERRPFKIDAIVVLPDHLHALLTLPAQDTDFASRWRLVRSDFSRWHRLEAPNGKVPASLFATPRPRGPWQPRIWNHAVLDDAEFERYVDFIHFDPVAHGFVAQAVDWSASSFSRHVAAGRYSMDWPGPVRALAPPAGAGPRHA